MRLIFFGSGAFGLPTFRHLARLHNVVAVVSQPDKPAGRKRVLTATPVAAWATEAGIETIRTDDANAAEVVERIGALGADAAVVIAFGQKLGEPLIAAAGALVVNLHSSLLPRFRGAAPINHAILSGETRTGVSVIGLSQRMDGGRIYATATTPIDARETAGELHDRLAELGEQCVAEVLAQHAAGTLVGVAQDDAKATRAPKLSKADGVVDFNASPDAVRCRVHGLTPWPGVRITWHQTDTGKEKALLLRRVEALPDRSHDQPPGTVLDDGGTIAVSGGAVRLLEVQIPGKSAMAFSDFAHGHAMKRGDRLTSGGG